MGSLESDTTRVMGMATASRYEKSRGRKPKRIKSSSLKLPILILTTYKKYYKERRKLYQKRMLS